MAVPLGGAREYLSVERILSAAASSGAAALHPGYGFLSENAALARACAAAGVTFVGPPAEAIEAMGDKIRAKQLVAEQGVPVVPGSDGSGLSDEALRTAALDVGLPVLLKPSAGGGGKGMRLVTEAGELDEAIAAARREALRSFGDDTLLVERYISAPRHIEVQVLADQHGNVVHLGERECSLQRRHQKIVEEAPSALLTPALRASMGAQAIAAARACGYTNAGTVELIVSGEQPEEFFFMEMNTRLQVEHPVTEMVTGLDLVELQLRIAAGEPLPFGQDDVVLGGHAVEARVYAEDPAHDFLPTGGRILVLRTPTGDGVRVDSGIASGLTVGSEYDPMLAKVIAHGADRPEAIARLDDALAATTILGVTTNVGFLRALLADPDVRAGRLDTELVDRFVAAGAAPSGPPDYVLAAVAVGSLPVPGADLWSAVDGWRLGGRRAPTTMRVDAGDGPAEVTVRATGDSWAATVAAGAPFAVALGGAVRPAGAMSDEPNSPAHHSSRVDGDDGDGDWLVVGTDGGVRTYRTAIDAGTTWVGAGGSAWPLRVEHRWKMDRPGLAASTDGVVTSPMPGTVLDVRVSVGDAVHAGQTVAVVEAMKMEHPLVSRIDGVVAEVRAVAGQLVGRGDAVVRVEVATTNEGS
jgi:acetyl-CoA/propionyl-CoA carboxylase biotin carboxyl carrier protein